MKITIEERDSDKSVLFFMEAETVAEAAVVLRVAGGMLRDCSGYAWYGLQHISGWVKIPVSKQDHSVVESGKI